MLKPIAGVACEEGAEQLCQCLCAIGSVAGGKGPLRGGEVYGGMVGWYIGQPFGAFFDACGFCAPGAIYA